MIRVVLPPHLRTLARVDGEVELDTLGSVDSFFGLFPVDTVLAVYSGTNGLGALSQIAANDGRHDGS